MNNVVIEPTQFISVRGPEGENVTWGYRIYDNYGSHYDNTLESIPDDDLELLKIVIENDDDTVQDMLEHLVETENGLEIGGAHYSFEEIKHIIS